jgi:hypothetical protein
MRQFYTLWVMYANENKGRVVQARYQIESPEIEAEFGFYEGAFMGTVLRAGSSAYTNNGRGTDVAKVIKNVLQCKSVDHSSDPDVDEVAALQTAKNYFGDYIYNSWMGTRKALDGTANQEDPSSYPNLKLNQIPGNVIILMESYKPNLVKVGTQWTPNSIPNPNGTAGPAYKYYFEKFNEIFLSSMQSGQPASGLRYNRIATPHQKSKKMNVLSADGHISLVDPRIDFFHNPSDQATVKEYLWNAKDNNRTGWKRGAPGV